MKPAHTSRDTTVPATSKARGIAAILLGGALAVSMLSFMAFGDFKATALVVFASILLAGIAFMAAGLALFRNGAMSGLQKGFVLGALVLVAVTVGVLREQLGLSGR